MTLLHLQSVSPWAAMNRPLCAPFLIPHLLHTALQSPVPPHTALSLRPRHPPLLIASGSQQWLLLGLTGSLLMTIHSALRPLTAHSSRKLLGTLFLESPALPHHCETFAFSPPSDCLLAHAQHHGTSSLPAQRPGSCHPPLLLSILTYQSSLSQMLLCVVSLPSGPFHLRVQLVSCSLRPRAHPALTCITPPPSHLVLRVHSPRTRPCASLQTHGMGPFSAHLSRCLLGCICLLAVCLVQGPLPHVSQT